MASMICRCGYRMSTSAAPNDIQLRVYTDVEWDAMTSEEWIEGWRLPLPKHDVWRCPRCERIYVFEQGYGPPIAVYEKAKPDALE